MRRMLSTVAFAVVLLVPRLAVGGELVDLHGKPRVIATVDGFELTVADYDRACEIRPIGDGQDPEAYRDMIIADLVRDAALYVEARRQGIDRDPKIRKMMINTLLRTQVYPRVGPIGGGELRDYYHAHAEEFVVPEKVQIKQIVIRVLDDRDADQARALAEALLAEAVADPSRFKALAQEHSAGPYARRGGDIGFVGRDGKSGIEPEVVAAAFELAAGEFSEVLEIDGSFHVVYVANRRDAVERTFEQMYSSVLRKVKSTHLNAMYDEFTAALVGEAEVVIDHATVEELTIVVSGPPG
jgi:parvulin-like peptidyl-prolyl isomerase